MPVTDHYFEVVRLRRRQVLARWSRGHIPWVQTSTTQLMDMFTFFLREVGTQELLATFPDGRLRRTIAIYFFAATLLFKAVLKANAYEALPSRLFSNTALLLQLGFNLRQVQDGFSRKGHQRPFDVESLLNGLRSVSSALWADWYLRKVLPFLLRLGPKPGFFTLDTISIPLDPNVKRGYPGASWGYLGEKKKAKGTPAFGYKLVVLGFRIGKKRCGVLAAQLHGLGAADIDCGRDLLAALLAVHPRLLAGRPLLVDRGFLDALWMRQLKQEYGIDTVVALKENMALLDFMRAEVRHSRSPRWERVPSRAHRRLCRVGDLVDWSEEDPEHAVPLVGCLVQDDPPDKPSRSFAIVTTDVSLTSGLAIYLTLAQRWNLEEGFCQLRKLEEFDRLTVAHYGVAVAQLLTECLAHTLAMLFLEDLGEKYEEIGARRLRYDLLAQPTVVMVEIGDAYALMTSDEFHGLLDANLQAMAARQRRDRARDGPGPASQPRS